MTFCGELGQRTGRRRGTSRSRDGAPRARPRGSLFHSRRLGPGWAGLGGPGGARGRAARPHFSGLPPSSRAVPKARPMSAERREREAACSARPSYGALVVAPTLSLRPGSWRPILSLGLAARSPRARRSLAPRAVTHEQSGRRTPSRVARVGAGAAASRR